MHAVRVTNVCVACSIPHAVYKAKAIVTTIFSNVNVVCVVIICERGWKEFKLFDIKWSQTRQILSSE